MIQTIESGHGDRCKFSSLQRVARALNVKYVEELLKPVEVNFDDKSISL